MAKYVLTKERDKGNRFDKTKVVVEVETDGLDDLIEGFQEFLNGCGFVLKGNIELVSEEEE